MEIAVPIPSVIDRLQKRLLLQTAEMVEEWAGLVPELTRYEDEHLLDAKPSDEALAAHRKTVERCLAFGRLLAMVTDKPDFPDHHLAQVVSATLETLADKLSMWHSPRMTRQESDRILAVCFPDES